MSRTKSGVGASANDSSGSAFVLHQIRVQSQSGYVIDSLDPRNLLQRLRCKLVCFDAEVFKMQERGEGLYCLLTHLYRVGLYLKGGKALKNLQEREICQLIVANIKGLE